MALVQEYFAPHIDLPKLVLADEVAQSLNMLFTLPQRPRTARKNSFHQQSAQLLFPQDLMSVCRSP